VTEIVQERLAPSEVGQFSVWWKSPVEPMLEMLRARLPVLWTAMDLVALDVFKPWLPKLKLVGESLIAGAPPVPLRQLLQLSVPALEFTVRFPETPPTDVGLNVTCTEQLFPGDTDAQLSPTTLKGPLAAALLTFRLASPVFVTETDCEPLVVPT